MDVWLRLGVRDTVKCVVSAGLFEQPRPIWPTRTLRASFSDACMHALVHVHTPVRVDSTLVARFYYFLPPKITTHLIFQKSRTF